MKVLIRRNLRVLLHLLARFPGIKRTLVDLVYRFPSLDGKLRTAAHKVIHPEAVLDVDATRLPEASRRAYQRMRGSFPP
jgi:hypothetical protein